MNGSMRNLDKDELLDLELETVLVPSINKIARSSSESKAVALGNMAELCTYKILDQHSVASFTPPT